MPRWIRRVAVWIGGLVVLLVAVVVLGLAATQTASFRDWARQLAERQVTGLLNGSLRIGRLDGNLFTSAVLSDVRIEQGGRTVFQAERVTARYSAWTLLRGSLTVTGVTATRPVIVLVRDAGGWQIGSLVRRRAPGGRPRPFAIDSLALIDGVVAVEDGTQPGTPRTRRVEDLNVELALRLEGGDLDIDLRRSAFRVDTPAVRVLSLVGRVMRDDDTWSVRGLQVRTPQSAVDLQLTYAGGAAPAMTARIDAELVTLDELGVLPVVGGRGLVPAVHATVDGPLRALQVDLTIVEPSAGAVRADVVADVSASPYGVTGTVEADRVDMSRVLTGPEHRGPTTAIAEVDVRVREATTEGWTGMVRVRSGRSQYGSWRWNALDARLRPFRSGLRLDANARAYGAIGQSAGTLVWGNGRVSYVLTGSLRDVDLRRVPAQLRIPALESRIAGRYAVSGTGTRLGATLGFDDSIVEGVRIASGGDGRFDNTAGTPAYGFRGTVADVDVARIGRALEVRAISDDRYTTQLNGDIAVEGSGSDAAGLQLAATATLGPSVVRGAEVATAAVEARIADRTLTATVRGHVDEADLAVVTGRADLASRLAGDVDVRTTVERLGETPTLDSVSAEGTVALGPSSVGEVTVESARIEGRYANRRADVANLAVMGPAFDVHASGPLALGDDGESMVQYRITHTRLEDLERLAGQPLAGRLLLEGTITGNGRRLASTGTVSVDGARVGDSFEALEVDATFDAALPELRADLVEVTTHVESTLPVVAGRGLRSLTMDGMYASSALQFTSTVREDGRTVTGAGRATFAQDAREVTVDQLQVEAGGTTWGTPAAGGFRVRYEPRGLLLVDDLALEGDGQRLAANGTLGLAPGVNGSLDVTLERATLGSLGTLLLLDRQLDGVVNASARVEGDPANRTGLARIQVAGGVVDGFAFESLDTSLTLAQARVSGEATLQQQPGVTLTATGGVPVTALGAPEDATMDLAIRGDEVDLAVLEALVPQLDAVTGQLRVDVTVGGTTAAPRATGTVAVIDGAFTVAATGVDYEGLTLDASLEGEDVRIASFRLVDEQGRPMEGSGRLGLRGRDVRDLDFTVTASQFEILDNDLGELTVDSSLAFSGTVLAPKISGLVRVTSGRVEVDRVLSRLTFSPYPEPSRSPAPPDSRIAGAPDGSTVEPPRLVAGVDTPTGPSAGLQAVAEELEPVGLDLDLTVEVPGNLVVRGTDIQPADAAVALGSPNVTLGGDFRVRKMPSADPVLVGTVRTVRGSYDFQGRRFEVLRDGTIDFRGERPVDPALDVTAERNVSGIVAQVAIGGTLRSPQLMLSSSPPLDEADILSLIVFNQPANQLGAGQRANLGQRALGLASGLVVAPINDTLENALDVDLFEIEAVANEGGGEPAVTIGEQVGERLYARFRQIFGAQDASEVQLEYQIADVLRLQGSFAEGRRRANRSLTRRIERGGIDLVLVFSY